MEPDSGTTLRADGLRPVNQPRPVEVEADDRARPRRVGFPRGPGGPRGGTPHRVERIDEVWRVVDEWWRAASIARTYYRVSLDDGRLVTLFHDEIANGWFQQRY